MICYASRTGTKTNLEALRRHGWRIMVSASGVWRCEGFAYAIDNGAWTVHKQGTSWDPEPWKELVELGASDADFVMAPDIVEGGLKSLELTKSWLPWMDTRVRLTLIPVQDGMTTDDLRPLGLGRWRGIFLGGSDRWKEQTMQVWGDFCQEVDCWYHVGRVNTARRIEMAARARADSIDGSSPSRYHQNTYPLTKAVESAVHRADNQLDIFTAYETKGQGQ